MRRMGTAVKRQETVQADAVGGYAQVRQLSHFILFHFDLSFSFRIYSFEP
jgi:hypothetical protein